MGLGPFNFNWRCGVGIAAKEPIRAMVNKPPENPFVPVPDGYPTSVLRSAAVREMTSLRRLQFGQINSHRRVWVSKSPQHTLPKEVTKKH